MSDTTKDWFSKPTNAAAAGAAAALVLAMFTPAALILGVGGAVAAGAYIWKKSDFTGGAANEEASDSEIEYTEDELRKMKQAKKTPAKKKGKK